MLRLVGKRWRPQDLARRASAPPCPRRRNARTRDRRRRSASERRDRSWVQGLASTPNHLDVHRSASGLGVECQRPQRQRSCASSTSPSSRRARRPPRAKTSLVLDGTSSTRCCSFSLHCSVSRARRSGPGRRAAKLRPVSDWALDRGAPQKVKSGK